MVFAMFWYNSKIIFCLHKTISAFYFSYWLDGNVLTGFKLIKKKYFSWGWRVSFMQPQKNMQRYCIHKCYWVDLWKTNWYEQKKSLLHSWCIMYSCIHCYVFYRKRIKSFIRAERFLVDAIAACCIGTANCQQKKIIKIPC